MPRSKRYFGAIGLNHCIIRGINKRDIFFDNQDRHKFIKTLKEGKKKHNIKIGTYALMQNHTHFLIQGENKNISDFFKSIEISYATYFNMKYDRVGHLFQNRFKNKAIEDIEYLKNVVKYIHFNPEKAGIAKATDYLWSSYNEFFKEDTWIDKDIVLNFYDNDIEKALKIFEEQHSSELHNYYENYSEYEIIDRLTDEQVKFLIEEKNKKYSILNPNTLKEDIEDKVIKDILKIKGVNINQVCRITGMSRRMVEKLK